MKAHGLTAREVVDGKKVRFALADAVRLARECRRLVVSRGAKSVTVDLGKERPSDEDLAALLLGPSGNLRAPTVRSGSVLFVGFSEHAYETAFGG